MLASDRQVVEIKSQNVLGFCQYILNYDLNYAGSANDDSCLSVYVIYPRINERKRP